MVSSHITNCGRDAENIENNRRRRPIINRWRLSLCPSPPDWLADSHVTIVDQAGCHYKGHVTRSANQGISKYIYHSFFTFFGFQTYSPHVYQ